MAAWRTYRADGYCPDCDHWLDVFNDAKDGGYVEDGDLVRCNWPGCPRHTRDLGHIRVINGEREVIFKPWPRADGLSEPVEPKYAKPKSKKRR